MCIHYTANKSILINSLGLDLSRSHLENTILVNGTLDTVPVQKIFNVLSCGFLTGIHLRKYWQKK